MEKSETLHVNEQVFLPVLRSHIDVPLIKIVGGMTLAVL